MKYAQILNNKVHWIGEYDKEPKFHKKAGDFIDITDLAEQPEEGWDYDGEFIAPAVVEEVEAAKAEKIKVADLTVNEKWKLLFEHFGIPCE